MFHTFFFSAYCLQLLFYFNLLRLDENMLIKISDFGMTIDIHERDFYRVEHQSKPAPVRWMSLEAIQYSVLSTKNDIVG